jgi:ribosomal-protein-alanine N-acetyltransferase
MSGTFDIPAPPLAAPSFALRTLAVDDTPDVFACAADPEVARFTLWPAHKSEEFTRGFLKAFTAPTFMSWAIVPRDGATVAGMVFLHSLSKQHMRAEIAFNVGRSHRGRGLATEAARFVLRHSFSQMGLNRVEATCMTANAGSRRVLEKLGMKHEGKSRRSHRRFDGFHDMELYVVLRDEFGA